MRYEYSELIGSMDDGLKRGLVWVRQGFCEWSFSCAFEVLLNSCNGWEVRCSMPQFDIKSLCDALCQGQARPLRMSK